MYEFMNKETSVQQLNNYMLTKTLSMFGYEGLPETLNRIEIEKRLQVNGHIFIREFNGELYGLSGNLEGLPDVYGNPTKIRIDNEALKVHESFDITDGVFISNDDLALGVMGIYNRANSLLVENEITMYNKLYIARMPMLISAGDDTTKQSAELYLEKVVAGELGVVGENRLFEGIKSQQNSSLDSAGFTQLVEFNQYIKAGMYNEVGINANFNMKRERLNISEVEMNKDNLFPMVDNMLYNRQLGFNKVNDLYGTSIAVDFASTWKRDEPELEPEEEPEIVTELVPEEIPPEEELEEVTE